MTSLPKGWKFMKKQEKGLAIDTVLEDIRKAKQEIYDNAKYYSPIWKKEKLKELKVEAVTALKEAVAEVEALNRQYENRITEIKNDPFKGHDVSSDFINSVNYTKTRILAEIRMNNKPINQILEMAVASKSGAQAVLELIESKQIDNSVWTAGIYTKAFVNSKSQAELDFELKKEKQIEAINAEWNNAYNHGHYSAAKKILNGDVRNVVPMPTLERQFDIEIEEIDKQINEGK